MGEDTKCHQTPDGTDAEWVNTLHDIRTPLTVLLGRVQLLRRHMLRGADTHQINADLDAMEAAIHRLAAAIEQMDDHRQRDRV